VLPDGILNVVNGDKDAVDAILDHPEIMAIGFVGSTPIAQYIYARGCANGKRVQCFGGAKNHMIIMPDADMDQAVDALIGAGYGAAGERCMAISVAVPVGERPPTADREAGPARRSAEDRPLYRRQRRRFRPACHREARDRVMGLVNSGVEQGAKLVVDGRNFSMQGYENGFFIGGCLFDNVTRDMDIYTQEIFGPVLSVVARQPMPRRSAVTRWSHEYGNGTAIFTRDGDTARDFASRINIGMVGVNVPIPVPLAYHTFGGWKKSGFGDLNQHGPDAFRFYTRTKTVTARWPSGIKEGAEFVIPTMG
jgi:malonate-semialdehyde dehydrogenase (acetylating)/methylmalonate-semialdehyde dehydrogenase